MQIISRPIRRNSRRLRLDHHHVFFGGLSGRFCQHDVLDHQQCLRDRAEQPVQHERSRRGSRHRKSPFPDELRLRRPKSLEQRDLLRQDICSQLLTTDQASWPIKYVYSGTNGATNQISVNLGPWTTNTVPLNSQYTGLYGLVQPCTITATATPIGQRFAVPATVSESIQFASIPLFQFAIFYNMDLEIAAAADYDHRWSGVVQWRHLVGVNHRHLLRIRFPPSE